MSDITVPYKKMSQGDPMFELVDARKKAGLWACDSLDHNEPDGCSNPECFKHDGPAAKIWSDWAEDIASRFGFGK